jgi:hypothetical protein
MIGFSPSVGRGNGRYHSLNIGMRLRPASNISLNLSPRYSREVDDRGFVSSFDDPAAADFYGRRVVFAAITQKAISMETRLAVTFSPTLTLEFYAQPLVSSGRYTRFKEFSGTRTAATRLFDQSQLRAVMGDGGGIATYDLDADRDPVTPAFSFANPDFNLRSLRGSAVIRWEYRPGSTLYFVWQQSRAGTESRGDIDFTKDVPGILDGKANNVFLIKGNYWIGR